MSERKRHCSSPKVGTKRRRKTEEGAAPAQRDVQVLTEEGAESITDPALHVQTINLGGDIDIKVISDPMNNRWVGGVRAYGAGWVLGLGLCMCVGVCVGF